MIFNLKKSKKQHKYTHNTYKMNTFDQEILEKFIQSEHSSECVFGFELLKTSTKIELNTFSPSILRLDLPPSSLSSYNYYSIQTSCYEIELENSSFLPLYTNESINLFEQLTNIEVTEGSLFAQVLLSEHSGNWREQLISQYDHYLQGNDNPVSSRKLRKLQTKFLKLVDKVGDFQLGNVYAPEVEEKILQPNYRMEIRFLLEHSNEENIMNQLNKLFGKLNYFNKINLYKVKDTEQFANDIYNRHFSSFSKNTYFAKSELYSILSSRASIKPKVEHIELNTQENKQSPSFSDNLNHFLPKAVTPMREINDQLSKYLEKAFQSLGLTKSKLKVESLEQGATLQKISVVIPKDTNYMKIEKNIKNIQANLGNEAISMEIGDKPGLINFYVPCDRREVIYLSTLIESDKYQEFVDEAILPFIIGQDTIGNPLYGDLQKFVHVLIAGTTGSGKSVFINNIITSLILSKSPKEMIMYLIDPKKVEFEIYRGIPHVKSVINNMDYAYKTLISVLNEMERRYDKFAAQGTRNLEAYNKSSNSPLPYIVVVIDELADLMSTHREVENVIQRLGQKARAAGIHLIIATQRPSVDVITGVIKSNLPTKFCLRLNTSTDYKTVFGKGIPYTLLGNGDGVAAIEGNVKEFERFQSPVISLDDSEVEEVMEKIKDGLGQCDSEGIEIIEPEGNLEKLKRIIATTNESRITHLQKEMKIRTEDVQSLMADLAEEGWVEKQGRSYAVIAPDELLDEWRN